MSTGALSTTEQSVALAWQRLTRWRYRPALITAREALRMTRIDTDAAAFRVAWDARGREELRRDTNYRQRDP